MNSDTTKQLFGNSNIIKNRLKAEITINFLTNAGSKIVDEPEEITVVGQTKFYLEMIANILSPNEMTKNTE